MKQLIWDLPTRLFHWMFAGSILSAFAIAKFVDDESAWFSLHIVFGVIAGLLLVWRLVWGLIGSRHARFRSMRFSPAEIKEYLKSVLTGKSKYYAGHNPAGGLAAIAMLALAGGTVLSGAFMNFSEAFEELHEVLPMLLMAVVAAHVLGVALASIAHRESYVKAMFNGYKTAVVSEKIESQRPFAALVLLVLLAGSTIYFVNRFDFQTRTVQLPGIGINVQFGESEEGE